MAGRPVKRYRKKFKGVLVVGKQPEIPDGTAGYACCIREFIGGGV
jgi:hypothetical protein